MATHKIGKLKFNISRHGFAYRWGDGEIRRLPFGKSGSSNGGQADYGDASEYPYGDAYYDDPAVDDSDYREDDYAAASDDGYYDDGGYYADEEDAYAVDDGQAPVGPVMEYIENSPWVVLALLVVLPPLGIYLLWRLNRFDYKTRVGVSAVSAVWFIVLLILLFSGMFGGRQDEPIPPQMTLTTSAPTMAPTPTPSASAEASVEPSIEPDASPSATPRTGDGSFGIDTGTQDTGDDATTYVYSPQTGLYYHSDAQCANVEPGTSLSRVTVEAAKRQNKSACPLCIGGSTVYYGTKDGSYYHTIRTCSGMKNAVEYSKASAEAEGKTACPVCAGGKASSKDTEGQSKNYFSSIRTDKSGIKVFMTKNGKYYHTKSNCSGMTGASEVTLLEALKSGKTGCSVCSAGSNKRVFATEGGKYYHTDQYCQGMKNAKSVTLSGALVIGKKRCPVCVGEEFYSSTDTDDQQSTVFVYAKEGGKYYHTNSTCSGMTGASKVTLKTMLEQGRPACPVCASSADMTVYVSQGGKYYHSYATCSGMTNAKSGPLAQALAYGFTACPKCWNTSGGGTGEEGDSDDGNAGYSGVYVYATETSTVYHVKKSCSKAESGVTKVLLEQAMDDGKTACPTCASIANDTVYATKSGKYFHKVSNCSGMTGAKSGSLAQALAAGYTACPVCYGSDSGSGSGSGGTTTTGKFVSGTSNIKVYATLAGKYYHMQSSCSGISGTPSHITLETALNSGKTACPNCASSADRSVYATKGGKYFHYSSSCAGSSAAKGPLDVALAYGLKACPNCVTGTGSTTTPTERFTSGTSGIKVYGTTQGKYFHNKSDCSGMTTAKYITLETALNYGLRACPSCAALAGKKVYAVSGANVYHYDSKCAGSGAKSGTLAEALAYGMDGCAVCVKKQNTDGNSGEGEEISAPADTTVYIDLSGTSSANLYHKSDACSGVKMKNGTPVTLQYALNHGFGDCGYCNPPTSVSE